MARDIKRKRIRRAPGLSRYRVAGTVNGPLRHTDGRGDRPRVQHVIWAADAEAAIERFRAAHPTAREVEVNKTADSLRETD